MIAITATFIIALNTVNCGLSMSVFGDSYLLYDFNLTEQDSLGLLWYCLYSILSIEIYFAGCRRKNLETHINIPNNRVVHTFKNIIMIIYSVECDLPIINTLLAGEEPRRNTIRYVSRSVIKSRFAPDSFIQVHTHRNKIFKQTFVLSPCSNTVLISTAKI